MKKTPKNHFWNIALFTRFNLTMIVIHSILCHLGVLVIVDGGAGVAEVGGQQRGLAVHQRVEHIHPLPGVYCQLRSYTRLSNTPPGGGTHAPQRGPGVEAEPAEGALLLRVAAAVIVAAVLRRWRSYN